MKTFHESLVCFCDVLFTILRKVKSLQTVLLAKRYHIYYIIYIYIYIYNYILYTIIYYLRNIKHFPC